MIPTLVKYYQQLTETSNGHTLAVYAWIGSIASRISLLPLCDPSRTPRRIDTNSTYRSEIENRTSPHSRINASGSTVFNHLPRHHHLRDIEQNSLARSSFTPGLKTRLYSVKRNIARLTSAHSISPCYMWDNLSFSLFSNSFSSSVRVLHLRPTQIYISWGFAWYTQLSERGICNLRQVGIRWALHLCYD